MSLFLLVFIDKQKGNKLPLQEIKRLPWVIFLMTWEYDRLRRVFFDLQKEYSRLRRVFLLLLLEKIWLRQVIFRLQQENKRLPLEYLHLLSFHRQFCCWKTQSHNVKHICSLILKAYKCVAAKELYIFLPLPAVTYSRQTKIPSLL